MSDWTLGLCVNALLWGAIIFLAIALVLRQVTSSHENLKSAVTSRRLAANPCDDLRANDELKKPA